MKKILAYIIIGLLPFSQVFAVDTEQLTQKSRAAIKALGSELKSILQTSMKKSGPIDTISVCNTTAPQISNKISEAKGMSVARTSLKYRNQENKPDEWENQYLSSSNNEKQKVKRLKPWIILN